jgi:hypothetical protein
MGILVVLQHYIVTILVLLQISAPAEYPDTDGRFLFLQSTTL